MTWSLDLQTSGLSPLWNWGSLPRLGLVPNLMCLPLLPTLPFPLKGTTRAEHCVSLQPETETDILAFGESDITV
jgi:hypothetical protein